MSTILDTIPARFKSDFPEIWKNIIQVSEATGISPALFLALIRIESNFNRFAVNINHSSNSDINNSMDKGLMQINSYFWKTGFDVANNGGMGRIKAPEETLTEKRRLKVFNIKENIEYGAAIIKTWIIDDVLNPRGIPVTARNIATVYHFGHLTDQNIYSTYTNTVMGYYDLYTGMIQQQRIGIATQGSKEGILNSLFSGSGDSTSMIFLAIIAISGIALYQELEKRR